MCWNSPRPSTTILHVLSTTAFGGRTHRLLFSQNWRQCSGTSQVPVEVSGIFQMAILCIVLLNWSSYTYKNYTQSQKKRNFSSWIFHGAQGQGHVTLDHGKWCITPDSLVYTLLQNKGNFQNVMINRHPHRENVENIWAISLPIETM